MLGEKKKKEEKRRMKFEIDLIYITDVYLKKIFEK